MTAPNRLLLSLHTAAVACLLQLSTAFQSAGHIKASLTHRALYGQPHVVHVHEATRTVLFSAADDESTTSSSPVQEYKNAPTKILSNFMGKPEPEDGAPTTTTNPIDSIDFTAPKFNRKVDLDTLAAILDYELYNKEWFVTGNANPIYFSDAFEFQDPDVKLSGIEDYARGVYKLFDQTCSRAEIISTVRNEDMPNTITCTWRLSGRVSIGPGLTIKPYICYTDFTVDEDTGLITMQEDRFDIPQWDILLSALFPFLIGKITSPPAPPLEPRKVELPKVAAGSAARGSGTEESNPFGKLLQMFGN